MNTLIRDVTHPSGSCYPCWIEYGKYRPIAKTSGGEPHPSGLCTRCLDYVPIKAHKPEPRPLKPLKPVRLAPKPAPPPAPPPLEEPKAPEPEATPDSKRIPGLVPKVQALVDTGELKVTAARKIAKYADRLQLGKARKVIKGEVKASAL